MLFIVVIVMSIRILITAIKSIFTVLAHCQSYYAMLSVAVIIGFGKGTYGLRSFSFTHVCTATQTTWSHWNTAS